MDGRQRYKQFKEIINTAIASRGNVFGGAVRDITRHEMMCKKYFASGFKQKDFSNIDVSPETVDRLLIPSDIDVHFTNHSDFIEFRETLRHMFYETRIARRPRGLYTCAPGVLHIVMHAKLNMTPLHILKSVKFPSKSMARSIFSDSLLACANALQVPDIPSIKIDVLVSRQFSPPFNNLDFKCNGLVMNSNGVRVCDELTSGLDAIQLAQCLISIMDDISNKHAVAVTLSGKRWDKMEAKGWSLKCRNLELSKKVEEGDECILCMTALTDESYKLNCCPAKYHLKCLSRQMTFPVTGISDSGKCPHCRQACLLTPIEIETFGVSSADVVSNLIL